MSEITSIAQSRSANKTENGTPIVEAGKETDKDLFLKMLVAQMQNQDPFNPQDPTQYVTQLAQFTMLDQTMALNENMEYLISMNNGLLVNSAMSGATSLIGKNIEAYGPIEDGKEYEEDNIPKMTGKVESVHIKDGVVYMNVRDDSTGELVDIEYGALIKVSNDKINTDTEVEDNTENKGE